MSVSVASDQLRLPLSSVFETVGTKMAEVGTSTVAVVLICVLCLSGHGEITPIPEADPMFE